MDDAALLVRSIQAGGTEIRCTGWLHSVEEIISPAWHRDAME